jgi:hypothetical protein
VVEGGCRLGLAQEPGPRRGRRGLPGGKELEGYGPLQPDVLREPDHTHAPAAEFPDASIPAGEQGLLDQAGFGEALAFGGRRQAGEFSGA